MARLTFAPQITLYQYLKTVYSPGQSKIHFASDQCQISKIGCFEKVVDGFELLTIFAKRSILDIWHGSEYGSAVDNYSSLRKKLIRLQKLSRLLKDRNIKLTSYCLHSKEYFLITNQICEIFKQITHQHMRFSLITSKLPTLIYVKITS